MSLPMYSRSGFALLLLHIIAFASAAYDPGNPPQTENFDPAEANPAWNITCLGSSYDYPLPKQGDFDPNTLTMQQLCAKPQYGGAGPGQHIGGVCLGDDIVFDTSPGAQVNAELSNPRIRFGCVNRCFCNHLTGDLTRQPVRPVVPMFSWPLISEEPELRSYQSSLDNPDDLLGPPDRHRGVSRDRIPTAILFDINQVAKQLRDTQGVSFSTPFSIAQGHQIQCRGDMPPFQLDPFTAHDFNNDLTTLCSNALNGGYVNGNAGGFCYREDVARTVWFSDELTPRHDWTWTGGNFNFVASLRFYCYRHCVCASRPTRDPAIRQGFWRWLDHQCIVDRGKRGQAVARCDGTQDGPELQGVSKRDGNQASASSTTPAIQILPAQVRGQAFVAGSCGRNGKDFCPSAWNTGFLGGPPPKSPSKLYDDITAAAKARDLAAVPYTGLGDAGYSNAGPNSTFASNGSITDDGQKGSITEV